MKNYPYLIVCALLCSAACHAQPTPTVLEAAEALPADMCSARFSNATPMERVEKMRDTVREAIATLDNARLSLSSPSLASGNINYLDVTPNFADDADHVCVLGYFTLERQGKRDRLPLLVDHIEVIKQQHPVQANETVSTTRIYFRTPRVSDFENGRDLEGTWRFWERHQSVKLSIAAFQYQDGKRGAAFFGATLEPDISSKSASISAALMFALLFYLLAAATVPGAVVPGQGRLRNLLHATARRLAPWQITGATGSASLSQLQMMLFTLIVASLLFYQWLRTGLLQQLSTDLLYLIGLSTAGAAGTQLTAAIRKELEPADYSYAQRLGWFNAPPAEVDRKAGVGELLMSNKRFDIYKFQMVAFTCVIAAYVIAAGADQLADIQISATLLTLMGMSQGAYVGGRATGDTLAPLQDQLRGMQELQARYQASADASVRDELRRRFRQAADQARTLFGNIYGRTVPDHLLDLPLEALSN